VAFISVRWLPSPAHFPLSLRVFEKRKKNSTSSLPKTKNPHGPSPHPRQNKKKTLGTPWVHAEPSHWLHEIRISKTVCHHLSPGLMEKAKACGGRVSVCVRISLYLALLFS